MIRLSATHIPDELIDEANRQLHEKGIKRRFSYQTFTETPDLQLVGWKVCSVWLNEFDEPVADIGYKDMKSYED